MKPSPNNTLHRILPCATHVFNNWSRTPSNAEQLVIDGRNAPLTIEEILRLLDFVPAQD